MSQNLSVLEPLLDTGNSETVDWVFRFITYGDTAPHFQDFPNVFKKSLTNLFENSLNIESIFRPNIC